MEPQLLGGLDDEAGDGHVRCVDRHAIEEIEVGASNDDGRGSAALDRAWTNGIDGLGGDEAWHRYEEQEEGSEYESLHGSRFELIARALRGRARVDLRLKSDL